MKLKLMKAVGFMSVLTCMGGCMGQKINFEEVLAERRSGYTFDESRAVGLEDIVRIAHAGRSAPSSYNNQPWVFIVCDRTTDAASYDKALSTLVPFNQQWASKAPVLVVVAADTHSHKGEYNKWAQYDTGAAAGYMMLQATALGLMAHQMGGFDAAKISTLFALPTHVVPMAVMAIGYAGENESRGGKKERKPLSDNFFVGSLENGLNEEKIK
jgi:nitroreductase